MLWTGALPQFVGYIFWPQARRSRPSVGQQGMQTLQIEGQAHQAPFARGSHQATQGELPKAQDFFDDANDGLDRAFPQAIDHLTDLGLKFVSHLDLRTGVCGRGFRLFVKEGLPTLMMRLPASRDVRLNAALLTRLDGRRAEVTVVQSGRGRRPQVWG